MKTTKVLVAVALTGILGTGLYAGNNNSNKSCKGYKDGSGKSHKMMKKRGMHKGKKSPLSLLKQLNLTSEQTLQISNIKKDMMKTRVTPDVAFSKDSFDKAKFIEIMKQKRDNMIESKAEMIDRVYKVLTAKQKEQFKVLMELKKEKKIAMMDKRMSFDKNSNGRR